MRIKFNDPENPTAEIDYIQRLESRAESVTRDWLRSRGWKDTSNTVDCYWMWKKEIDGVVYFVETSTARRIQEGLDRAKDYELHPELYEG